MQKIGSRLKYAEICHIHDFEKWEKCGNIGGSLVPVIEGGVPRTGHVTNHVEGGIDLVTIMSQTSTSSGQVKDSEFVNQDPMFSRTAPNKFWMFYTLWSTGFTASKLLCGLWMHASYYKTMTYSSGMMLISA